jgi:hypothetical protein
VVGRGLQENNVKIGKETMPQASAEVIYFSLPCNFVNSYRQNNPYHFSLACWISQFQENGTQGTTEKSRPTRKRRRDPVADPSSLEPRAMRLRKRTIVLVVHLRCKRCNFFTFLVYTPISSASLQVFLAFM